MMMNQSLNDAMLDDGEAREAQSYADNFGESGFDDPSRMYISQKYDGYTEENQATWTALYDQQMGYLSEHAWFSSVYPSYFWLMYIREGSSKPLSPKLSA